MIQLTLKEATRGGLLLVVKFNKDDTNFDSGDLSWVPTIKEMKMLSLALQAVVEGKAEKGKELDK